MRTLRMLRTMGTRHRGGAGKRLARISLLLGLVAVLALWSGASVAHAAPATTTTISTCDEATLDSAIANAASGDTISFGCGADIKLTQTLTISKNLTLDGSGQSVTLDGNNSTQVLSVNSGVSLTLNALTISHGNSSADGGGVYNNGGTVTISNSTFANDVTSDFDGGGGVYNNGGTVTISNSTFANNQAVGHNGGGGLLNDAGTVTISNSTFANNQASFGNGGGIRNIGTLTISNSTFAGNTSGAPGGGIEVHSGMVSISNSTFAGNSSGGFVMFDGTGTIGNSIFANNTGGNCLDLSDQVISSAGYNVESGTDCGFRGTGDLQNADPKLAPLANYGGPTQTMALLFGSPAIGASKSCSISTDQRAFARGSSSCDIGAFDTDGVPAVSSLTAKAQDGQVTLSWQDASHPVSAYRVVLIGGSGSVGTIACTGGQCTTTVSSLTSGTTYTFVVVITPGQQGGAAAEVTATPQLQATITLGNLTQTYDGTPRSVTVTTDPANLTGVSLAYTGANGTTYASSTTPPTNAGSYSVTASLTNPTYVASPVTDTLTVNQAQTKTSDVSSSASPSVSGQPVTFTASVSVQSPGGGTPTGTVQFAVDGNNVGSPATLSSGGSATSAATSSLSVASHKVTAVYSGNGNFKGSDNTASPFSQVVNKANTRTSLSSSANPSSQGQTVTFTAAVSVQSPGAGSVDGSVIFMDGTTTLGTGQINTTNGSATYATSSLAVGGHSITAAYGGSTTLAGSVTSSALSQNVDTNLSSFPTLPSGAYNLTNANLSGAYLVGATLAGASLSNTNLKGANLSDATLKGASLTNANLAGSDLSGVDLSNADLTGANLSGANLSGANLSGANLTNATLKGATGLKSATLTGVIWSKTTCPDSTVSNQDGGTCLAHL